MVYSSMCESLNVIFHVRALLAGHLERTLDISTKVACKSDLYPAGSPRWRQRNVILLLHTYYQEESKCGLQYNINI